MEIDVRCNETIPDEIQYRYCDDSVVYWDGENVWQKWMWAKTVCLACGSIELDNLILALQRIQKDMEKAS